MHDSDEIERDIKIKEITQAKNHNMIDLCSFSIIQGIDTTKQRKD